MSAIGAALAWIALVFAGLGVLLDLWSLYAWLRKNRSPGAPSGVPGAALLAYFALAVQRHCFWLFLGLAAFHAACHVILPRLHRRLVGPPPP